MASATSTVDLNANEQGTTIAATVPFVILAIVAVVSRFYCRKIQSSPYEFDDWIIVVALVSTIGCFILSMEMVHYGAGKHLATVPPGDIPKFWKVQNLCRKEWKNAYRSFCELDAFRVPVLLQQLTPSHQTIRSFSIPPNLLSSKV